MYAGISVFSGNGVTINGANIDVTLRGLTINGQGGSIGILVQSANRVNIERVAIGSMLLYGIDLLAGGPAFATSVTLADVDVRNSGDHCVHILPTAPGIAHVVIDHSRFVQCGASGIYVDNSVQLVVRDSLIARNGLHGLYVFPDSSELVDIVLERNLISDNASNGLNITGAGIGQVWMSRNTVSHHLSGYGVRNTSAGPITIFTTQDNAHVGNAFPDSPATPVNHY